MNGLPGLLRGGRGLALVWLVAGLALLVLAAPMLPRFGAKDPDDFMRLLQVRDWLGGQSYWDVHQYRMNPPHGADMHWSRLVDMPIAAMILGFRLFMSDFAATRAAMSLIPLIELLVAMVLTRRLLLALGEDEATALTGAAILPLFPLLTSTFLPLRIDHHGWQGVMAVACVLASRRRDARGAVMTGAMAAIWMTISVEGLMLVAPLTGLFAWRHAMRGERFLAPFLGSTAGFLALLFVLTRPLSQLAHPVTDAVSWPHIAGFAGASLLAYAMPRLPGQRQLAGRLAALALVAMAGGAIMLGGLGMGALNPFARMDPIVHRWWFVLVPEGLPITSQDASNGAMLIWTLVLVGWGWWHVRATRPTAAGLWFEPAAMALVAALLSLVVMRTAVVAQLLCAPFSAVLIAYWLPRARGSAVMLVRVVGTLLCLVALTPSLASAAGKLFTPAHPEAARGMSGLLQTTSAHCDLGSLGRLRQGHIFASMDMGPELLVRTNHTVVMSGYHRNDAKMREVIEGFGGDPHGAEALVRANHADYVALCASDGEAHVMASRAPGNLANQLLSGHPPAWLRPIAGFEGPLLVYAVMK